MLVVKQLIGGYGKKEILHGIDFSIDKGEVLCILGPNGCGKSTLLKLLLQFLPKKSGTIIYNDEDLQFINRKSMSHIFAYIPQSEHMMFPYTVLEMVIMGRTSHMGQFGTPKQNDLDLAYKALEQLNITQLAHAYYNQLSGGQRQLVLIARALCQDTNILIMDEPTSSLDFANQQLIMEAMKLAVKTGKSIIMTTHSPSEPFLIATKVLLLSKGKTVGYGKPLEVLTHQTLEQVYGIPMDVVTVTDRNNNQRSICLPTQ